MSDHVESINNPLEDCQANRLDRRTFLQRAIALGVSATVASSILAACGSDGESAVPAASESAAIVKGGRLRVGLAAGSTTETLNPFEVGGNEVDLARTIALYEKLVTLDRDGSPVNQLVEEFSPSADARVWKIKLRSDVTWHDGSDFTADDVVYTLRWIATPSNNSAGYPDYAFIKPENIVKVDKLTVEFRLDEPNAIIPTILSARSGWIVKDGTTDFTKPNGTGPWKFQSFDKGQRSLFVANPDHRDTPYLDELEYITFTDQTAKFNALQGGQLDAADLLDAKLVSQMEANPEMRILRAPSGLFIPIVMACDMPPFDDNRVRLAFRLMCDRQQMLENVYVGQGKIGNDLFCPVDPDFNSSLPQRPYDPEQAKALLKEAGAEGLEVSLYTGEFFPGALESATLFAEQAKLAGVKVSLDKVPGDQYFADEGKFLHAAFAQDVWSYRPLTTMMAQGFESTAIYNDSHWYRPEFDKLVAEARTTLDDETRRDLWWQAQEMLYNEGGYIIWGFSDQIDAYSEVVQNLQPSSVRSLGYYDFTKVWLAK